MKTAQAVIRLATLPPSKNVTKGWHWGKRAKEKAHWQESLGWLLVAAKVPKGLPHLCCSVLVRIGPKPIHHVKAGRPMDPPNLYPWAVEVMGDALVACGHIPDDGRRQFTLSECGWEESEQDETVWTLTWRVE